MKTKNFKFILMIATVFLIFASLLINAHNISQLIIKPFIIASCFYLKIIN